MTWLATSDLHLSDSQPKLNTSMTKTDSRTLQTKMAFRQQRMNAKRRGIEFKLTLDQWIEIWEKSGKFLRRGKLKGCFCMSRYGDIGPYQKGNVFISSVSKNNRDATLQRDPLRHKEALVLYWKNNPPTNEHKAKISASLIGRKFSDAHKQNLRLAKRRIKSQ